MSRKFAATVVGLLTMTSLAGCAGASATGAPESTKAAAPAVSKASAVQTYLTGSWKCPQTKTTTAIGVDTLSKSAGSWLIANGGASTLTFSPGKLVIENATYSDFEFFVKIDDDSLLLTGTGKNRQFSSMNGQEVKIALPEKLDGDAKMAGTSTGGNGDVAMSFTKDTFTVHDSKAPTDSSLDLTCRKITG
ncbi:hypothetical protein [Pseudarthrobacter sp. C4D7]|uniref:hypothetical protein n=1 Tax=Pseudarthrobacter sp. C4D7 TaxID=2735268 RepID=UPI0015845BDA|nr:hypothetical protein [Pseudarthrobacter sp. C4D7]NUT70927.1 hypothetical protein [Pseudarthrobacter sp. C4D7]